MAKTNAQKQRAMRQEELREFLSKQKLIEKVIDNIGKIEELDPEDESFANRLKQLEVSCNQRSALIRKYLPDLKQQEIQLEAEHTFAQVSDEELERIVSGEN